MFIYFAVNGNVNSSPSSDHEKSHKTLSLESMYQRLVYFAAISDNHFDEAKDMLASVKICFPEKKIILYDLGLNQARRRQLTQQGNIELRPFPFKEYSNVPYLKNLFNYGWKPIITHKVSFESDVLMYGDASLRLISCNITPVLEHLRKFPFFAGHPIYHKAIEFTHDGMIKYLEFPRTRKDMADTPSLATGIWLLLVNSETRKKIMEPWFDCALHKECMAPAGSQLGPCHFTDKHDGHYVGCHRYDQSALNLILAREYGLDYYLQGTNLNISNGTFFIKRKNNKTPPLTFLQAGASQT